MYLRCSCNVNSGQYTEYIGLHYAREQTEYGHDNGKTNGAMVNRVAIIIASLIIFPNRRTASASVREISPMILKGNMISRWL